MFPKKNPMKLFFTTCALIVGQLAIAQSIQPEVIASAGEHFVGSNAQLSFTVGEVVIETVTSANSIITQGFHQPDLDAGSAIEDNLPGFISVNIYPNPAAEQVFIELDNNSMDMAIEMFDMTGKLVEKRQIPAFTNRIILDVNDHANASYLLNLHSLDNEHFATYKLQKTR